MEGNAHSLGRIVGGVSSQISILDGARTIGKIRKEYTASNPLRMTTDQSIVQCLVLLSKATHKNLQ
jgi:hypothetical protein